MNKFKIGDKVLIRKDSEYYGCNEANPKEIKGIIDDILDDQEEIGLPIRVKWTNGKSNSYGSKDLKLVDPTSESYTTSDDEWIQLLINHKPKTIENIYGESILNKEREETN